MEKNVNEFDVVICAVLFGCNDSLIGLDLGRGFKIKELSLYPKDKLNNIFEIDEMELRREYETARLNDKNLSVACIYYEGKFIGDEKKSHEYFATYLCGELFTYLDNQIRTIRLLLEGPLRYEKIAIKMSNPLKRYTHFCIIPIGEAFDVYSISKVQCDSIEWLSKKMKTIKFPFFSPFIVQAHILYDRSYMVTLPEAEVLLITSLEILYINDRCYKKECLAKRCSTYLDAKKDDKIKRYNELRNQYKNRSDYIHDGTSDKITKDDIIFLRRCVRESILKMIKYPQGKNELITTLKKTIAKDD
jgi:hypothetical protein